jgi:hypothetical protein
LVCANNHAKEIPLNLLLTNSVGMARHYSSASPRISHNKDTCVKLLVLILKNKNINLHQDSISLEGLKRNKALWPFPLVALL